MAKINNFIFENANHNEISLYEAIRRIKIPTGSGTGTVTSVGLTMPSAFTVTGSPITTSGVFTVAGAGTSSQYIDGTGALQTFPSGGTGTVTSVSTAGLISGGPITTTGTITTSMNTNKLVGRGTAGVGVMEEITLGTGLSLSGTTLNATATGGGIKSGTATQVSSGVYTTTITGVTSYTAGDTYIIKFTTVNDGASTLNINSLGAINIFKNTNTPIASGDIKANQEIEVVYDGTNFQAIGLVSSQLLAYVHNAEGATISKGQVVYAYQASGNKMSVKLAKADSDATSAKTIGLVYDSSIGVGGEGYIIIQGVIEGINTAAFSAGDTLYLSGTTFGGLTNVKSYAPIHLVYVGIVERANAGNGQIYVRCQNGYELDEIHDVDLITNAPVNNDLLTYVTGSPNLWKNRSLGAILGGTTSQYVRGDGSLQTSATTFGVTCDGQGGVVTTGLKNYIRMPFSGTITGWSIISSISGSAVFDIWKSASGLPTVANTITGSAKPTLTANTNVVSSTLTGWNTSVVAGDYIGFNLDSCSTCVWLILQIYISKT